MSGKSLDADDMFQNLGEKGEKSDESVTEDMVEESQWELFKTMCTGSWSGVWLTYDQMGSQVDDVRVDTKYTELTEAGAPAREDGSDAAVVAHEQTIWAGQVSSACERCTDSADLRTMPLGAYAKGRLGRHVVVGPGVVSGPRVLRSGAMTTELSLRYGKGRVRCTFQHAPSRLEGTPEDAPPDGLKVFRVVVAREAIAEFPPTPGSEASEPPGEGQPVFWRGVSPFKWYAEWGGNSWTYGPQQGHLLWDVPSLEEADAWHGRPRGDNKNTWTLKLPGGLLLQCPAVVTAEESAVFRAAWLPRDDVLRRVEARVTALQPLAEDEQGTVMLAPPTLINARVDAYDRRGDLADVPVLVETEEDWGGDGRE